MKKRASQGKECLKCGLINPSTATACDCGHRFPDDAGKHSPITSTSPTTTGSNWFQRHLNWTVVLAWLAVNAMPGVMGPFGIYPVFGGTLWWWLWAPLILLIVYVWVLKTTIEGDAPAVSRHHVQTAPHAEVHDGER